MLNPILVEERLDQIRNSVNRLALMKKFTIDEFIVNPDNFAISEHHLRRSLEALFDIGRHIIAKKGLGKPENYQHILEILGQQQIIAPEFSRDIRGMAGYRNRMVHGYARITPEEIYEIINTKLDHFARYNMFIMRYLDKETGRN